MAITHEGTETATVVNPNPGVITVSKPTGAAENDVAIAAICSDDDDPIGVPSGFTEINNLVFGGGDASWAVGYKVLGASEPSSYDFLVDDSENAGASISIFRGVSTDSPIDTDTTTNTGNSTTPTALSITTLTDGAAIIAVAGHEHGGASPWTPPSGMTELVDLGELTTAGFALTVAWEVQSSAGATGDKSFTASDEDTWGATLLALRDASAPPPPIEEDIGLATELNVAFSVDAESPIEASLGLSSESSVSFPTTVLETVDIGVTSELSQAFQIDIAEFCDLGLVQESSSAFSVEAGVSVVLDVGLATELDSSFPVSIGLDSEEQLGLSQEFDSALSVVAGVGVTESIGLASETDSTFPLGLEELVDLGLGGEANISKTVSVVEIYGVGLSSESTSSFSISVEVVLSALLGLARESTRSFRLDSGLPPFRWAFYDQTTPGLLPSRRRFRPLILTDRATNKTYIIKLGDGLLLELEEADKESQMDELFLPFQEPTMKVGDHTIRIYVENGKLKWEFYSHHVRNRPILFGKVLRPKPRQPRYILILDEGVLDETEQDT